MPFRGEGVKWWEGCVVLCYVENKKKQKVKLTVILICTPWILGCHLVTGDSITYTNITIHFPDNTKYLVEYIYSFSTTFLEVFLIFFKIELKIRFWIRWKKSWGPGCSFPCSWRKEELAYFRSTVHAVCRCSVNIKMIPLILLDFEDGSIVWRCLVLIRVLEWTKLANLLFSFISLHDLIAFSTTFLLHNEATFLNLQALTNFYFNFTNLAEVCS